MPVYNGWRTHGSIKPSHAPEIHTYRGIKEVKQLNSGSTGDCFFSQDFYNVVVSQTTLLHKLFLQVVLQILPYFKYVSHGSQRAFTLVCQCPRHDHLGSILLAECLLEDGYYLWIPVLSIQYFLVRKNTLYLLYPLICCFVLTDVENRAVW